MSPATLTWREAAKGDLLKNLEDLEKAIEKEEEEIKLEKEKDTALYAPSSIYYWVGVALYVCAQALLSYYISLPLTTKVVPIGIPVNIGMLFLLLQSLHFIGSFRSIGVDDLAGLTLFGRPWYVPKSGLYLVPLWILQIIRTNRNYRDKRFPGPADKVYRVSKELQDKTAGGDVPPEGFVRPIFAMTGEPRITKEDASELEKNGVGNPIDRQLSVEISYFVRYRPDQSHGGIFRIARNLSAQAGDIGTRIEDLIEEQSERDMKSVISRHTPATIIENWDTVNKVFIMKLRLAVMRLGIDIDRNGGGLDELNLSHKTNEAQAEATRELFRKTQTITAAQATSSKHRLEREGQALGELTWLQKHGEGYKSIKEALGIDGDAVLASEAVRNILPNTDVILAGGEGGMKDLMTFVKGAQAALNTGKKLGETK